MKSVCEHTEETEERHQSLSLQHEGNKQTHKRCISASLLHGLLTFVPQRRNTNGERRLLPARRRRMASLQSAVRTHTWDKSLKWELWQLPSASVISNRANRFPLYFSAVFVWRPRKQAARKSCEINNEDGGSGLLWFMWSLRKHPACSFITLRSKLPHLNKTNKHHCSITTNCSTICFFFSQRGKRTDWPGGERGRRQQTHGNTLQRWGNLAGRRELYTWYYNLVKKKRGGA